MFSDNCIGWLLWGSCDLINLCSPYTDQDRTSLKDHGRRHSDPNLPTIHPGGEANDVISMESMKSSDVEFETGSLHDEIGTCVCICMCVCVHVYWH